MKKLYYGCQFWYVTILFSTNKLLKLKYLYHYFFFKFWRKNHGVSYGPGNTVIYCSDLIDTAHAFFMVLMLINCGYFELHREVNTDICVLQCLLFCLLSFWFMYCVHLQNVIYCRLRVSHYNVTSVFVGPNLMEWVQCLLFLLLVLSYDHKSYYWLGTRKFWNITQTGSPSHRQGFC